MSVLRLVPCASVVCTLSAVTAPLPASPPPLHGGLYRGPGSTIGPGGSTAGGPSTGGAGAPDTDVAAWGQWWGFNRDRYLALRDAVLFGSRTATGFEDYFLGKGAEPRWGGGQRPTDEVVHGEVVPALEALLEQHTDVDVLTGAMLALAKIGDAPGAEPRVGALLRGYLRHPNQEVHETAAIALGVLAQPDAAPLLADLALDTPAGRAACGRDGVPARTQAFATYGLGLVGYRADAEAVRRFVVHHLARAVELGDEPRRDRAVAGVLSLGLVRLPLGAAPGPEEGPPRPSASRRGQIEFLLALWDDDARDPRVRAHVPVAVARLSEGVERDLLGSLVQRMLATLEPRARGEQVLRHGVLMGAALIGDADEDEQDVALRRALTRAAEQGDRLGRNLALLALARSAGRPGAGEAGAAAEEVRALLLRRLSRGASVERPWAALGLALLERGVVGAGGAPSDAVRDALRVSLAEAPSPSEQGAAAIALGLVGQDAAAADLVPLTQTGDEGVRGYAAVALGLMGAESALPALRAIVARTTYRPGVLREAAIALALLGDKTAAPVLVSRLAGAERMFEQIALVSALGFVGDGATVPALLGVLREPGLSDTTRAFAAVALGMICDKEPYPWNSKLAADVLWWQAPATLHDPAGGNGVLDML